MAFAAIFIDADTLRIAGDYVANFVVGRKVRAYCGVDGYRFGYVSASSFAAGNTDVDLDQIVDDVGNDDALTANLATVEWSVVGVGPTGNQYVPREIDIERYINFSDAIDSIGGDDRTLVISTSYPAAVNKTVPLNVTLKINQAGRLAPAAGVTITIAHPIEAGFYQVFAGDGDILFSTTCTVYPEWWGAVGDESADDQPAIQAAINSIGPYFATYAEYGASAHEKGEVLLTNRYRVDSTVQLYDAISFRGLNPPSHGGRYYALATPPFLRPRRAGTQIVSNIRDGSNIIEVIGSAAEPYFGGGEAVVWYEGYIGGFTIWGTGATGIPGADGHGLALLAENFGYSTVENLLIRGAGQNGFHIQGTGGTACSYFYNTVSDVSCVRSGNYDWNLDGRGGSPTHNYFEHCRADGGVGERGFLLQNFNQSTFIDCASMGATDTCWWLRTARDNSFYGCIADQGSIGDEAIKMEGSWGNSFYSCYFGGAPMILVGSTGNKFIGCDLAYLTEDITGATRANPCVVTAPGHTFFLGQGVYIDDVLGMTELNGNTYTVGNPTADTFELVGVDSTGYGVYISDGGVMSAWLIRLEAGSDGNIFLGLNVDCYSALLMANNAINDGGDWNRIIGWRHEQFTPKQQDDYQPLYPAAMGAWQTPALLNAWVDAGGGFATAQYAIDHQGIVHLKGRVKDGVIGNPIFQLPAGYRPDDTETFAVASNALFGYCDVDGAGDVTPTAGNNTWFSISGITFLAEA